MNLDLRPIPSEPGYLAGSDGHIYSTRSRYHVVAPRLLVEDETHDGYKCVRVSLGSKGRTRRRTVAPMVAEAFYGPRPFPAAQVRHLDGNKANNVPGNLAYGTAKENAADRDRHGNTRRGMANNKARHTAGQVRQAITRVERGELKAHVAADLGVSPSTISRWIRGQCRPDARHPVAVWVGAEHAEGAA